MFLFVKLKLALNVINEEKRFRLFYFTPERSVIISAADLIMKSEWWKHLSENQELETCGLRAVIKLYLLKQECH